MRRSKRAEYPRDCPRCGSDTDVSWNPPRGSRVCENDACPWSVVKGR